MILHKHLAVSFSLAKTVGGHAISSIGLAALMRGEIGAKKLIHLGPPPALVGSLTNNAEEAKKVFEANADYTIAARKAISEFDAFVETNFDDPSDIFSLPPMLVLYDFDRDFALLRSLGETAGIDAFPNLPDFGQSIPSAMNAVVEFERHSGWINYKSEKAIRDSLHCRGGIVCEDDVLDEAVRMAEVMKKVCAGSTRVLKSLYGIEEQ
jgi:hypothetical protein